MSISRWYPIREVSSLQDRVNSLFQDFAGDNQAVTAASFAPAVDVYENGEKVVLKLDIPGIKEEDLDIRVENQTLTVRGERDSRTRASDIATPFTLGGNTAQCAYACTAAHVQADAFVTTVATEDQYKEHEHHGRGAAF